MTETDKQKFVWLGVYGHPDDETSASAGTMVKLANKGHQVYVAVSYTHLTLPTTPYV